jgi:hypothetical protein
MIHTLKPLTEVLLDLGRDRYCAVERDDLHACKGTSVFLAVQEMYPLVNQNELLKAYMSASKEKHSLPQNLLFHKPTGK